MMAARLRPLLAALSMSMLCGCATLPSRYAWRPWTRTFENTARTLPLGARLAITCEGTTEPSFARDIPMRDSLASACAALLRRRGFGIGEPNPDFTLHIKYSTSRQATMDATSSATSSSVQATSSGASSGAGAYSGNNAVGVAIAGAFLHSLAASKATLETSIKTHTEFDHVLAMEIDDVSGSVVWEGNAQWRTPWPEVRNGFMTGAKLLFSNLPSKPGVDITVPEVEARHLEIAYWLHCNGEQFSAPGLPYTITFNPAPSRPALPRDSANSSRANERRRSRNSGHSISEELAPLSGNRLPSGVHDGAALFAYLDLVSHAEIALPVTHSQERWDDPLDPSLWARVQLGGNYRLGPSGTLIKVLVTLVGGRVTGTYQVSDAHIASDAEYSAFQTGLSAWHEALRQYYDVTVH